MSALMLAALFSHIIAAPAAASGTPPVANDQSSTTSVPLDIFLDAFDAEDDPLTYTIVSGPAHGTLDDCSSGSCTYTPTTGYLGPDSFTWKANDGTSDSNVATYNISVVPNEPPVANDQSITVRLNTPRPITLSADDPESDALTFTVVSGPAHGSLTSCSSGSCTYTPTTGYLGPDSFTWKANDGTSDSNVATMSITVRLPGQILILESTVSGGDSSLEAIAAGDLGYTADVVDDATWGSMSQAQFRAYRAIVIGDPTCGDTVDGAAGANASVWQPAVMTSGGNKVIIGTDPVYHAIHGGGNAVTGAPKLIKNGISFAAAKPGATGAYIDISCEASYTDSATPFSFLDGLTTHAPGSFTTEHAPCLGAISIVAQSGPTSGLHDSDLSDWSCSVHQDFKTWASDYTPLAIATDAVTKTYCANDVDTGLVACGAPYVLISGGGVVVTSSIKLDPPTATNLVATSHTVTATITTSTGSPVPGKTVTFFIESGPDVGATGTGVTDSNGQTTFAYTNNGTAGTDTISASFVDEIGALERATATKTWVVSAHLTLTKSVDNTGGGTALATAWTLSATGPTTISGHTGDASITNAAVGAGTYTLAETGGPTGYSPGAWSCTGGTLTGSSLVLAAGETASCSITNTFIPTVRPVGLIAPTDTTCQQYVARTAATLLGINYSVSGGKIDQNINPGVFFYFSTVTVSVNQTVTTSQSTTNSSGALFKLNNDHAFIWDSNCKKVGNMAAANGGATGSFTFPVAGTYILQLQYQTKSIARTDAPSPINPSYTFDTEINAVEFVPDTTSVSLVKK